MSQYMALYRKWRPGVFSDVVGQEHITKILKSEIMQDSVSHAYLFCGSRGTGKTTCAKILAKAISCENPTDGDPCGECEKCRNLIYETINKDRDLLIRLDAKMDLVLEKMKEAIND